jgi:hypothetical protein
LFSSWLNRSILIAILFVVIITGIIAWVAPPNTYDSLTYHMSRVAHWTQEGGVRPYASGILRQNYMSPGAEMLILHTYVLAQSDQFANLIQWFAMVVSLVGVSQVAKDLGANSKGQQLAALFAATLPMGIAQASSTMTDYVTAAWVILAASEVLRFIRDQNSRPSLIYASTAAGLAILTKPTAAVFLLPLAIWAGIMLIRVHSMKTSLGYFSLAIFIVLIINLGYLTRNWLVFNNLVGGGSQVQLFTNEMVNLRVVASNVLRNASLHAGTPWAWLNDQLYLLLAKVHWKLDLGLTDPRTSYHPFFTIWPYPRDEARATNTIHAVLMLCVVVIALVRWKKLDNRFIPYVVSVIVGFTLFATVFKFDILGSRYHMPFFILAAPLVAVILVKPNRSLITSLIALLLFIGALPILFQLKSRALLSSERTVSIFRLRRLDQYFAQAPNLDEPYILITEQIEAVDCNKIGLMLRGDTGEYPLWVLLEAPRDDLTVDWIISKNDVSGKYRIQDYKPCAVICQKCDSFGDRYNDIPLAFEGYGFRLFLTNQP